MTPGPLLWIDTGRRPDGKHALQLGDRQLRFPLECTEFVAQVLRRRRRHRRRLGGALDESSRVIVLSRLATEGVVAVVEFQCAAAVEPTNEPCSPPRRRYGGGCWSKSGVRGDVMPSPTPISLATSGQLEAAVADEERTRVIAFGVTSTGARRIECCETFYFDSGRLSMAQGRRWRQSVARFHAVVDATAAFPAWANTAGGQAPEPLVLVCTNGRHDACCATFGRPVVRACAQTEAATGCGSARTSAAIGSPATS